MSDTLHQAVRELTGVTGELRGEVHGLRDTLSRMNTVCALHEDNIRKNTNFRHYCKGAIALGVLFFSYVGYQIETLKEHIKALFG